MASFADALYGNVVRIAGWRRMFRAVMVSAIALCAQSGDWAQVRALAPGTQVEVKRFSGGDKVRGVLESVSDEGVVVQGRKDAVTIDRSDVRRLRLESKEKTKSGRIAGATVLGGLGGISGYAVAGAAGGAYVGAVYAGVGYLIGWAFDGRKRIVVYEVETP